LMPNVTDSQAVTSSLRRALGSSQLIEAIIVGVVVGQHAARHCDTGTRRVDEVMHVDGAGAAEADADVADEATPA